MDLLARSMTAARHLAGAVAQLDEPPQPAADDAAARRHADHLAAAAVVAGAIAGAIARAAAVAVHGVVDGVVDDRFVIGVAAQSPW